MRWSCVCSRRTARLKWPVCSCLKCSNQIWHGFVPGLSAGAVYGYRVYGSLNDPHRGLRFNPNKLLVGPLPKHWWGFYLARLPLRLYHQRARPGSHLRRSGQRPLDDQRPGGGKAAPPKPLAAPIAWEDTVIFEPTSKASPTNTRLSPRGARHLQGLAHPGDDRALPQARYHKPRAVAGAQFIHDHF